MGSFFQRYLLPGFVFQGVLIGGGYATGRELVEFFLPSGPIGGLLGMAVAAIVWGLVMAVSFELCRANNSYDYRHFFQNLLGPAWILYEFLFVLLMIVVLAVVGAASGEIVNDMAGIPQLWGSFLLLLLVGIMVFFGSGLIERFMGVWSVLIYGTYLTLVIWSLMSFGSNIEKTFVEVSNHNDWFVNGLRYAGYNVSVVPMVFFCLNHITKRRVAITAGMLAGVIGIFPAVFLYIALLGLYDEAAVAAIPSALLIARLGSSWFELLFQIVLLGTFVQTGVGLIHGVNERIARTLEDKGQEMPRFVRPLIAAALLSVAVFLASAYGIVSLIANGYGLLTFGFIIVFVIPVLTVGLLKIVKPRARAVVET